MLEMNPGSFYSELLLICVSPIVGLCVTFLKNICTEFRENREKKIFELYCKRESDNFYVWIMILEIAILIIIYFLVDFCLIMIERFSSFLGYGLIINERVSMVISAVISTGISSLIIKCKWVRKRLLGDKEGKILILSSILILNIGVAGGILGETTKNCSYVCIILYLICECLGVLHFQGRYIKYDFSSIKLCLNNGESITCKDIEKVRRRKKYVIVENEDGNIVLPYEKIWKTEYYGLPKFVLIEGSKNYTIPNMIKFLDRMKNKVVYCMKQRMRGFLKRKNKDKT